ncbi:putative pectate lyase 18 [Abeliophyllum distichum]|uniref:Pectate lyase n=1 Tax=Abeliophyllum distichum TaxID=126358 RepID=A0ABD1VQH8_9LAMI
MAFPSIPFLSFIFCLLIPSLTASSSPVQDPELVVEQVHRMLNASRRKLGFLSCNTGESHRRLLEVRFQLGAKSPEASGLRNRVWKECHWWKRWQDIRRDRLWRLRRGQPEAGDSPTCRHPRRAIVDHICKRYGGNAMVRDSPKHFGWRTISDGDGVSIFGGSHVWVDHCSLSNCHDGLVDAIQGSTAITISNNYMTHHDKVMLLGHSDAYDKDKNMQVTIAFNHFGEGLVQRMPRCRHGYFHVVNNDYTHWEMYAIGGSAAPTINSQGNRFLAPDERFSKEVTKHEDAPESEWKNWNWRSEGDLMLNGAYFIRSGAGASSSYARASSLGAKPSSLISSITSSAWCTQLQEGLSLLINYMTYKQDFIN